MTTVRITQPLKWHGGKHYLAPKIIDLMPRHLHYVEPYGGGLSVLLSKDPHDPRHQWGGKNHEQGISEVVNDVYHALQNFWSVLQHDSSFELLQRKLTVTPFSESEFENAVARLQPMSELDVDAAVAFFVRCRQSRTGGFKSFATLSQNRTRRKMNEQASAWLNAVDGLPEVHARLSGVVILCRDAVDVVRQQDGPKTLFYLDPPYLASTRVSKDAYEHEMAEDDHREMLETIKSCEGKVMLSGYPNRLYDEALAEWNRHDIDIDNKVSAAKEKERTVESIWCNF